MLRLFVAIDIPGTIKEQLSGWKMAMRGARWTQPDQMHSDAGISGRASYGCLSMKICARSLESDPLNFRLLILSFRKWDSSAARRCHGPFGQTSAPVRS